MIHLGTFMIITLNFFSATPKINYKGSLNTTAVSGFNGLLRQSPLSSASLPRCPSPTPAEKPPHLYLATANHQPRSLYIQDLVGELSPSSSVFHASPIHFDHVHAPTSNYRASGKYMSSILYIVAKRMLTKLLLSSVVHV